MVKGMKYHEWHCGSTNFGLILLFIVVLWLARDMGWIPSVPMWPLVLILFGLWMVLGRKLI